MPARNLLLGLLLLFPLLLSGQGLRFVHSDNYQTGGNRTIYYVYRKNPPQFTESFAISFEAEFYDTESIGNIMRVGNRGGGENYVLAFSYDDQVQSYIKFNIEGKRNLLTDTLRTSGLGAGRWVDVDMRFYLDGDSVWVEIDGRRFTASGLGLPPVFSPAIEFGSHPKEEFAAFSLRNLTISSEGYDKHFPLNEASGIDVHDSHGKVTGRAEGGQWLVNRSYFWEKIFTYESATVAAVAYDRPRDRVMILNADSVVMFDNATSQAEARPYSYGRPLDMRLGTNFIDPEAGRIYTYEVNNLPDGDVTVSVYDIEGNGWEPLSTDYLLTQRHLHASHLDRKGGRYIIFGGFGNRQYSREFVGLDMESFRWSPIPMKGDRITPRFTTAMGAGGDGSLYVFGGAGNSSGDQTVGLLYYQDLYRVELADSTTTKLWERESPEDLVPLRNIIVADDGQSFMALCYPILELETHMQLYRYSITDGSREKLGDRIPITSQSILTNANLYHNRERNRYYCVVQEFLDETCSRVTVYSLYHPAVGQAALSRYDPYTTVYIFIAAALLLAAAAMLYYYLIPKRKVAGHENRPVAAENRTEAMRNALYLFGDFTVYDRQGRDITHNFSRKIRQILVLVILATVEEGGISSRRIGEAIWPDKDPAGVKNIKGVAMNQLRKALEDLDGISLKYHNGIFKVETAVGFHCDYREINVLIGKDQHMDKRQHGRIAAEEYERMISRGRFLAGFDSPCFDRYKRSFEEKVFTVIPVEMSRLYREGKYDQVLKLSSALFAMDPLGEAALWYGINSLRRLRREEEARERYYFFKGSYRKVLGSDYVRTYNDIVTSSPESVLDR